MCNATKPFSATAQQMTIVACIKTRLLQRQLMESALIAALASTIPIERMHERPEHLAPAQHMHQQHVLAAAAENATAM